jgi:hypothetical protein
MSTLFARRWENHGFVDIRSCCMTRPHASRVQLEARASSGPLGPWRGLSSASRPCLGLLWDGGKSRPTRMYFASCGRELCLNLEDEVALVATTILAVTVTVRVRLLRLPVAVALTGRLPVAVPLSCQCATSTSSCWQSHCQCSAVQCQCSSTGSGHWQSAGTVTRPGMGRAAADSDSESDVTPVPVPLAVPRGHCSAREWGSLEGTEPASASELGFTALPWRQLELQTY